MSATVSEQRLARIFRRHGFRPFIVIRSIESPLRRWHR